MLVAGWLGPPPVPLTSLTGFSRFGPPLNWGVVIGQAASAISGPIFVFMVAFVLNLVLRKPRLSWGAFVLFMAAHFLVSGGEASPQAVTLALAWAAILAVIVGRFGLLAIVSAWIVIMASQLTPLTTDLSAWYAPQGAVAALLVIGLALYGFVVSVGAKRLALRGLLGEE